MLSPQTILPPLYIHKPVWCQFLLLAPEWLASWFASQGIRDIVVSEGGVTSLWRGGSLVLARAAVYGGLRLGLYQATLNWGLNVDRRVNHSSSPYPGIPPCHPRTRSVTCRAACPS